MNYVKKMNKKGEIDVLKRIILVLVVAGILIISGGKIMDSEKDKNEQEQSSQIPSCSCSGGQGNTGDSSSAPCCGPLPANRTVSIIKKTIFLIVVIAALAVAFNSVARKNKVKQSSVKASINTDYLDSCGIRIESVNVLNKIVKDKDFIFMVLPDKNKGVSRSAADTIEQTLNIISGKGVKTETLTLNPGSPDYDKLVNTYRINRFPAVFALGKGCSMDIVSGEITEEKLLRSYLIASKPMSSGCGANSSCR